MGVSRRGAFFPGRGMDGGVSPRRGPFSWRSLPVFSLSLVLALAVFGGWVSPYPAGASEAGGGVQAGGALDTSYLSGLMAGLAAGHPGSYGMCLKMVDTGEEAGYEADRPFYAASCYKVPLVMYVYENAAAGAIDLDSVIVYGSGDHTDGTGIIQFMPVGTPFTVRRLCEYAIVYSDNVAARMLKRVYGYQAFRDYAGGLGCPVTGTYGVNHTTAREMCVVLERALRFADANPLGREVLGFLRASIYKTRIPAGLPAGVGVGNKTGDYGGYANDAAIVFLDDGPYILCVLSSGAPGDHVHAEVSRRVYGELSGHLCGGGHCTTGTTSPSTTWYFAEGTTRQGFETWLCLANPGGETARVEVEYLLGGEELVERAYTVYPHRRQSILLNEELGEGRDVSAVIRSDVAVLAERPVYFHYAAGGSGGHCVVGAATASRAWYFAEGCTREGFDAWLCIANPNLVRAEVEVVCMDERGSCTTRAFRVAPASRFSLRLEDMVEEGHDVSLAVSCGLEMVVERPLYFLFRPRSF